MNTTPYRNTTLRDRDMVSLLINLIDLIFPSPYFNRETMDYITITEQ